MGVVIEETRATPPGLLSPAPASQTLAASKVTQRSAEPPNHRRKPAFGGLAQLVGVALFALALWGIHHALAGVGYWTLWRAIVSVTPGQIVLAMGCTVLGYIALTGYDTLALRYVGHRLSYSRTGLASFISFALSNSIGLAFLTGASVRARLYSSWGVPPPLIRGIIAFGAATLWLGILTVAGAALVFESTTIGLLTGTRAMVPMAAGCVCLLLVGAYFFWCGGPRRSLTVRGWVISPPELSIAFRQLGVAVIDWLAAAGALYTLLPAGVGISYVAFAGLFVVSQGLGLLSHVPGGLGVFEGTMLLLAGRQIPVNTFAGALLAFRGLYYLVPLLGATVVLTGHEAARQRRTLGRISRAFRRVASAFAAPVLSVAVFGTGTILLLSGATPTVAWRLALLRDFVPLPLLEASHFVSSLVGAGLILLAYGLYRRMNAAWALTVALLVTGAVASLLKGLDFEEAMVASAALAVLLPARSQFYRRSSLLAEPWSPGWTVAVAVALATSIWLGLFAYQHVEYSNDLWWQFAFGADAPRFLRSTVGAVSLALLLAVVRLLRPERRRLAVATPAELERAHAILAGDPHTAGNVALVGDKSLLFSTTGSAFLAYAVQGRSWVAMGDPVGSEDGVAELVWSFRELVDRHGGWPVFYEVSRQRLPLFLEQGLTLLKLGEEARVPLQAFSLDGARRASLRRWRNAAEKAGCEFQMLPAGSSDDLVPELRRISDDWITAKKTREKRFSLGSFDPTYMRRFPLALVRQQGRPVAFATVWTTGTRDELSVDLMRYASDACPSVMNYLLGQLMLWGRREGYRWFNLGMAPLAGLKHRAMAPLWNRLGAFVFVRGEGLYGFQGLREYKDRFDPVWEPRYLACPGGLLLPFILPDIAALIGGGFKGVFTK